MEYIVKNNETTERIEVFFDNNGEELVRRISAIIDKFEVQKTKRTEEDFKMEFTPIIMDVATKVNIEFNASYEKYVKSGRMDCYYNCSFKSCRFF